MSHKAKLANSALSIGALSVSALQATELTGQFSRREGGEQKG